MKTEHRLYHWDNIKWFLICCVVLGHVGNQFADVSYLMGVLRFWIYLFHMPAFIFVAGLFSKHIVNQRRWDRVVPYLLLFIFMKTLEYVADVLILGWKHASFYLLYAKGVPWFALGIFWFYAITILVRRVKPSYVLAVAVIFAVLSGYMRFESTFLVMRRTIVFYPFFYAGYAANPGRLSDELDHSWIKITAMIVLTASFVFVWVCFYRIEPWRRLFLGRFKYVSIGEALKTGYALGGVWRIFAYIISTVLMLSVFALLPRGRIPLLSGIGQRTLSVYALHDPFIKLAAGLCLPLKRWITEFTFPGLRCLLLAAVVVLVFSLPLFDRAIRAMMHVPLRERQNRSG